MNDGVDDAPPGPTGRRGIQPIPRELRTLGLLDGLLLWANLSVSLLVIVAGAFLVLPVSQYGLALSLPQALAAIVAAAIVGNLMVGLGGLIGADAGVPAMVLLRAPLGRRGSYLPTGLNILQCLGWSVFELIVIATGASALSERVLGFGGVPFWKILFGAVATGLAFLGPVGFVRRYVRKFAVWVVITSLLYLGWWSLHGQHVNALWHRPGAHAFWPAFDLVLASIVSWTPLVADYTRFSRTRSTGFWSAGLGYFIPTIPLFALGAVIALSREISDAPALLTAIAAGGAASVLALLALTVDESDEAFANVYSGAVSIQNLLPGVPQRLLVGATAAVATGGALLIDLRNYQPFLYLLGSFFVPLFGVLLADWLLAGRRYGRADIFGAPAWRPELVLAWLAGFCVYQWLYPDGPAWWTRLVEHTHPHSLPWGGASLPSFFAAFGLAALARGLARAAHTRQCVIVLLGNLARDIFPDEPPRVGGAPYYAARALQQLDTPARIYARCALDDRAELLPPVVALGTPVQYVPGAATASFEIEDLGDTRRMRVAALGDTWLPNEVPSLPEAARWVHVAPLTRAEFPPETLAVVARGRRVSLDGQGLVRPGRTGELRLDADYDPEVLRHVWVLKLNDEEAELLGDPSLLPVREVLVTHGSRGVTVYADGRVEHVPVFAITPSRTGAGDGFSIAYLAARAARFSPAAAARRATAVVASILSGER